MSFPCYECEDRVLDPGLTLVALFRSRQYRSGKLPLKLWGHYVEPYSLSYWLSQLSLWSLLSLLHVVWYRIELRTYKSEHTPRPHFGLVMSPINDYVVYMQRLFCNNLKIFVDLLEVFLFLKYMKFLNKNKKEILFSWIKDSRVYPLIS